MFRCRNVNPFYNKKSAPLWASYVGTESIMNEMRIKSGEIILRNRGISGGNGMSHSYTSTAFFSTVLVMDLFITTIYDESRCAKYN